MLPQQPTPSRGDPLHKRHPSRSTSDVLIDILQEEDQRHDPAPVMVDEEPTPIYRYPQREHRAPQEWWRAGAAVVHAVSATNIPEPTTAREALSSPQSDNWRKAMEEEPMAGHLGVQRTFDVMKRDFWWLTMRQDTQEYVRACDVCQRVQPSNQLTPGMLSPLPIPLVKWNDFSMDFIGPFPTSSGFNTIFVVVDRLSKMCHFIPTVQSVTASQTAQLLVDNVVKLHGWPSTIVSDRDPRFTSDFWKSLMKHMKVHLNMSSADHPETDGQTERMNRTLLSIIRAFTNAHGTNWATHLSMFEFAYNNATHEGSSFTPFFLNYAQHPRLPHSLGALPNHMSTSQFVSAMDNALMTARAKLAQSQRRQLLQANKHRRDVELAVNDLVLVRSSVFRQPGLLRNKTIAPWTGPFRVLSKVGTSSYRLQLPPATRQFDVFHVSKLRVYYSSPLFPHDLMPPALNVDGEPEYEVQEILKQRDVQIGRNLQRQFLVRWVGYSNAYDEWVPEETLREHANETVDEFIAGAASH